MAFKPIAIYGFQCLTSLFQGLDDTYRAKEETDMRRTSSILMVLALAVGVAINASAKRERKEQPKARDVEETLEVIGGEHFPDKIKIKRIASIEVGDTYYHIFEGKLEAVGFHVIVFDNYNNYLGYYKSGFPPCNYQKPESIVIDSGDVNDDGDPLYFFIPITVEKGLPTKVELGGVPTRLVKNPNLKEGDLKTGGGGGAAAATAEGAEEDGKVVPEFREWTIKFKGQELKVRAIYIKQTFAEVTLKAEASGKERAFPINSFSKEDREYIKQFK